MSFAFEVFGEKSRLKALLEHFSQIEDPREPWRVAHPLAEVLLLVVCATMADCDDYDAIAAWGEAHMAFLRRYLPYHHGVPGGRWLTLLMNRIDPTLFSAAFTAWVREMWPERPDFVAIDGKTSRRSYDRAENKAPLHLVSAFATTRRLVLGQEAVEGKANELTAIPALIDRLAERDGLKGALVSIDAIATNAKIAQKIKDAGADYLFAAKANQPTLLADIESAFALAASLDEVVDCDKGHGRVEQRTVSVIAEVDWLDGERRFPGEVRLPGAASIVRVRSRAELADRCRFETRYYISSRVLSANLALEATRGHWGVENRLHWVLDVVFAEDQARLRKGHGANNMAIVRHFALNLIRASPDKRSIKLRRKIAGWSPDYLADRLGALPR
jgi:predicted transposase YbfD/YdcC